MGRRRRNARPMPEGTWPVELFKSEVRHDANGSKTWITWFRNGSFESRSFFHLNAEKLRPIIETHARALGMVWEGDVIQYLKTAHYADHHAVEGWEGYATVKYNDDRRYTLRIAQEREAL